MAKSINYNYIIFGTLPGTKDKPEILNNKSTRTFI